MLAVSFSCWARARQIGFVFAKNARCWRLFLLGKSATNRLCVRKKTPDAGGFFSVGRERDIMLRAQQT
jgi:hypothetical protein